MKSTLGLSRKFQSRFNMVPPVGRAQSLATPFDHSPGHTVDGTIGGSPRQPTLCLLTPPRSHARNDIVKRLCALWLLFCVGFSFPAAGGSAYLCLAESLWENIRTSDCCNECQDHEGEPAPCCFELDALPDGQSPEPPPVVPVASVTELHELDFVPTMRMTPHRELVDGAHLIRGPTASERRACLSVWRL